MVPQPRIRIDLPAFRALAGLSRPVSAWCARYARRPPCRVISRDTTDGFRPITAAMSFCCIWAARQREISSLSANVSISRRTHPPDSLAFARASHSGEILHTEIPYVPYEKTVRYTPLPRPTVMPVCPELLALPTTGRPSTTRGTRPPGRTRGGRLRLHAGRCSPPSAVARACAVYSCRTSSRPVCGARPAASLA